ncbi:hypothetical protein IKF67_02885 [Candidatus Saccharibacteria bacterium]|nr:hypothetical protein [Candidatus Saccharibacteria bacterium]
MKYFGTDGIRQKADAFTPEFLSFIVKGLVNYGGDKIKVFIAGDNRESSEWILSDISTALETLGTEYFNAGILPTPAINYCFYQMGFDFAIDVTASHNPHTDNGIKIFERGKTSGVKLCEEGCQSIEDAIIKAQVFPLVATSLTDDLHQQALELYRQHLLDYVGQTNFNNLKIGMDCANGATSVINKTVFEELGANITLINCNENYNTKINDNCGSTHTEMLQELVKNDKLDFGVAYDGDGDRCLLVDNTGTIIDGDDVLAILADYYRLPAIATTVMANQGLINWAKDHNIKTEITAVGDANVKAAMDQNSISLGGEQSGHIILPNESTGDGMLTALVMTKVVTDTKKSLHELANAMQKSPQVIVNLTASPEMKTNLKESKKAKETLLEYNQKLDKIHGRLLVRPSGTENLIRIAMWGDDEKTITTLADELKTKLEEIL